MFGTRPEAIKLAPVIREFQQRPEFSVSVCSSGQHREMVKQVTSLFHIDCDHDLDIMKPGQELSYVAAAVMDRLAPVIRQVRPDVTIVQGDTTTAFAAGLCSFYCGVPVAHVEAGLRTWDMQSPFPEEANRVLLSRFAALHFAPTAVARDALLDEGVSPASIRLTGNTVVDAALHIADCNVRERPDLEERFSFLDPNIPLVLFTMHRRESFGAPMRQIFEALAHFTATNNVQVLFPVHPNPNVWGPASRILGAHRKIHLVEPLSYEESVHILSRCRFVATDSGGLVEEAPTFAKPALVLRETTERPESVDAGCAQLCGTDTGKFIRLAEELLVDGELFQRMSCQANPFGDGQASRLIADAVGDWHKKLSQSSYRGDNHEDFHHGIAGIRSTPDLGTIRAGGPAEIRRVDLRRNGLGQRRVS